jgi:outer membrane protein OmpA-like peptidoglycan-associated protein
MNKKIILGLIFFTFIINISSAQKDDIYIAEDLIYSEDFNQAIQLYQQIVKLEPENPLFQYNLGFCYLNTRLRKDSSIICFNNALNMYSKRKHKGIINLDEVNFYLGRAYRVTNNFDSAIIILEKLESKTSNRKFKKTIQLELELAHSAMDLYQSPVNFEITNLGNEINTIYTEHTPVFSIDESILIFTSRRQGGAGGELQYDDQYDEDIYISEKIDGIWTSPIPISDSINTDEHEATIGLSYDGLQLFIYKEEEEGSIYYTYQDGDQWFKPIKLGPTINTRFRETHASLTIDGNSLYFTSSRPGGFGGQDIYISNKMTDGSWGPATNLGASINTIKDEEGPYIHPDGVTLYFSSKGHEGMGGYDIFKSVLTEFGTWGEPQNIGYPINTVEDDVFYFPTADGNRAYYASYRDDSYGKTDIYLISIPTAETTDITILTGQLSVCEGKLPRSYITITDKNSGDYYLATPNKKGRFIFVGKRGNTYTILVETEEKIVFTEDYTIALDAPYQQLYKAIRLDPEVVCEKDIEILTEDLLDTLLIDNSGNIYDEFLELENILFDFGKADEITYNETLEKLCEYLKNNSDAIIEIGAYADAKGKALYNYTLSLKRGNIVKKYLTDRGVNSEQLEVVGYGEENPVAINLNNDGTWNVEGQKFNRRAEFRVVQQGETTLLIWPFKVTEELKSINYKPNYHKVKDAYPETNY